MSKKRIVVVGKRSASAKICKAAGQKIAENLEKIIHSADDALASFEELLEEDIGEDNQKIAIQSFVEATATVEKLIHDIKIQIDLAAES